MDLRNCRQCGKMFNYVEKPLCPECLKKKEEEFMKVKEYIRENPSVGISEVAEVTETSVNQIRQWIREERLILTSVSADAGINCESCGRPITTGRLCSSCKNQVTRDLTQAFMGTPKPAADNGLGKSKGDKMRYLSNK